MLIPNKFPTQPSPYRIALIGEAGGADEERLGEPFVGQSGRLLAALLAKVGTTKEACFLGNISQQRPPNNDFSLFAWDGPEVQQGLAQLRDDLKVFKPNVTVLLGNVPLKAAKDPSRAHPLKPNRYAFKNAQWRGSLFLGNGGGPFDGLKCLSTYHPAYCLRDHECVPLLDLDLKKAIREGTRPELVLPEREFIILASFDRAITQLVNLRFAHSPIALDIEGGLGTMSCISFSNDPHVAYVLPFFRKDCTPWWSEAEELKIWRALALLLEDPQVPKVLQNSLYDRFVLHYSYGIRVQGVVDDTMLRHWELNSELEKSLGVQTSIYTSEPWYKGDRKTQNDRTFFEYCGRDSAVTLEINQTLAKCLTAQCSIDHYRLNVALLNPLLYMELRGIRYDVAGAKTRRTVLQKQMHEAQARLNTMTGRGFAWQNVAEITDRVRDLMMTVKGDRPYKKYEEAFKRMGRLTKESNPSLSTIGELEDLCEVSLNLSSDDQFIPYLYEELKLPTQFKPQARGDTSPPKRTADYEALLKLARHCQKEGLANEGAIIAACIEIRALETRQRMLGIHADGDGRIRCGYNIVGSNTGRIACYESPTGSGFNLQTIPNYTNPKEAPGRVCGDRDLFLADEDHWFFQCDLRGADSWTVAAYCAMLGDSTMLEDLRFGLKSYLILAAKLRGYEGDYKDRPWLKEVCKKIEKDSWDAFACKGIGHGKSYGEGDITVSRSIFKNSEGKLYLPPAECGKLGGFFMQRYPGIACWHNWVLDRIKQRPVLVAASGHIRQFNGRPDEIFTKAVAFEPQHNTTYAIKLALYKLWTDSENRVANGAGADLKIKPNHTVHDSLNGIWPKSLTAWAAPRVRRYFNNPLKIAGQELVIPFDGGYGPSWGDLSEGVI